MMLLSITQLSAQNSNSYVLPLKTGNKIINENIQDASVVENILTKQLFDGKSYILLQFYQLPDTATHREIRDLGVDLTQYVAANTYRATIPEGVNVTSLAELNVRAVDELTAVEKIEPLLLEDVLPEHVEVVSGKLDVRLRLNRNTVVDVVMVALQSFQIEYLEEEQDNNNYPQIRVLKEELESIAAMPFVDYVYPVEVYEDLGSGASRGSVIRSEYLNNVHGLKGEGVISGIFEGFGTAVHIDLKGSIIPTPTDIPCTSRDVHGTIVGGMAGGQGILRPVFQGVAPQMSMRYLPRGSVSVLNEIENYSSTDIQLDKMVLTNQSFPGGKRGEIDECLINYPEVMHVAAAGNAGVTPTSSGPADPRYFTLGVVNYPAAGIDNPLDTYMAAKNVTTVGAIDMYGRIINGRKNGSSKGPTWDGRLKPEIVAIGGKTPDTGLTPTGSPSTTSPRVTREGKDIDLNGNGISNQIISCVPNDIGGVAFGTSFAAPQVVGGLALLYEYYRDNSSNFNFNTIPSPLAYPDLKAAVPNPTGALMKAVACNSADDLGNPGPDFDYGFGKMNLRKAMKALENEQFINHRLYSGGSYAFNIDIPNGMDVYQLKVMLYWPDPAITDMIGYDVPNLIHNLDLELEDSSSPSNTYMPLVLDPTDEQSVTLNATQGVDTLNNVEQIVVTATPSTPITGTYTAYVDMPDGSSLTTPYQPFYLVWEFVEPGVTITSPYPEKELANGEVNPAEKIANGGVNSYYIEWDYNGGDDAVNDFKITITDDSGLEQTANVDGDLRMYKWARCNQLNINSSNVTVKVERLDTDYSDETVFSVYNGVDHRTLRANYLCDNKVRLSWDVGCGDVDGITPLGFTVYKYDEAQNDMLPITDGITTADYFYTVDFDPTKIEDWYAISASYEKEDGSIVETERCNAKRSVHQLTIIQDVFGDYQLDVPGGYRLDASGDYNANYIKTDDTPGATVIVNTEEELKLSGASRVRLNNGFSVKSDATFRADNEDCQ